MSEIESGDWPEELEPKQRAFLEAFTHVGCVRRACKDICNYVTHYRWLQSSELYTQCFEIAKVAFSDRLVEEASGARSRGSKSLSSARA